MAKFGAITSFLTILLLATLSAALPSDHRSIYHYQDTDKMAYDFGYQHADAYTGNSQGRKESRDGYGNVRGSYQLVEPDGSYRVVEYTADHKNGFIAHVKDKHGVRTFGKPSYGYDAPYHHGGPGPYHRGPAPYHQPAPYY